MKRLILVVILQYLLFQQALAQTSQPPKEMIEQIVALKTFFSYLKKGYQIVHTGLQTVNRIKNADFSLHDLQFDRLLQVSPAAQKTAAIYGTALTQAALIIRCQQLLRQISQLNTLTVEEQNLCRRTLINLFDECKRSVDEFVQLMTAGELELKEEERINRLQQLQQRTVRLEVSVRSFSEQIQLFSLDRRQQQHSVELSKKLNNLK
jgi:hypothetical protein